MALACRAALRLSPAAARRPAALHFSRLGFGTTAGATTETAAAFAFERLPDESASFPELFQPGRQAVLLAVDPDLNGAVAALCWHNPPEGAAEPGATDDASSSSSSVVCSGRTAGSSDSSLASGSSGGGGGSTANGAGRALSAQQQPAGLGVAQAAGTPACAPPPLHSVRLELFDMPVELWRYGSGRDKKHPDAAGLIAILERYSPGSLGAAGGGAAASPVAPAPPKKAGTKGSSKAGKRGRKVGAVGEGAGAGAAEASQQEQDEQQAGQDCAQPVQQQNLEQHHHHQQQQQQQPPVVRALVEYSTPQFISGKLSWYSLGFALGLLNGLLAVAGIPYERVPATTWKRGMGLQRTGKGGSIALACHLLPGAADLLKRKKDHGRAEALLLAAWGLGVRMQPIGGGGASGSAADAAADSEPEDDGLEEADG